MPRGHSRTALPPSPPQQSGGAATPRNIMRQEFGRRLFQLMLKAGMSQADLSRKAALGKDAISTYIRGLSFPEPVNQKKLARALDVTLEELLPSVTMTAIDNEIPALEIKVAQGHPDKIWIRVNQMVDMKTAALIFDALRKPDDAR